MVQSGSGRKLSGTMFSQRSFSREMQVELKALNIGCYEYGEKEKGLAFLKIKEALGPI